MKCQRSEIFKLQLQARNAGFEMDSFDAICVLRAGQVLVDRAATEKERDVARKILECWSQSLTKGDLVHTFAELPDDDEADEITEDVDRSKLSREDLVLLMLPGMDAEEYARRTNAAGHTRPEFVESNLRKRAIIAKQFELAK